MELAVNSLEGGVALNVYGSTVFENLAVFKVHFVEFNATILCAKN